MFKVEGKGDKLTEIPIRDEDFAGGKTHVMLGPSKVDTSCYKGERFGNAVLST